MAPRQKTRYFWTAALLILLAAALYCSWPVGIWLNPGASRSGLASELGAFGQPYNWLFIWADIVSGALLVGGCLLLTRLFALTRWVRIGLVLLAVYGVCGALDAGLPLRCVPSIQICGPIFHDPQLVLHGVLDYIGSFALFGTLIAGWKVARQEDNVWLPWIYVVGTAGIIFALLSLIFIIDNGPGYWAQRYYLTISSIWVASLPFVLHGKSVYAKKA